VVKVEKEGAAAGGAQERGSAGNARETKRRIKVSGGQTIKEWP